MATEFDMSWDDIGDNRAKLNYFKVDPGQMGSKIRVVSKPARLEVHWETVGQNRRRTLCSGADCPLCRAGSKLQKRFQILVLDRTGYSAEEGGYVSGGPEVKIYEAPTSVIKAISALEKDGDFGDPHKYDIKIRKTGVGMDTRYTVVPGRISDITDEEKEVVKSTPKLSELIKIPTAEEIMNIGYDMLASAENITATADDFDAEAPAQVSTEKGSEAKEDDWTF